MNSKRERERERERDDTSHTERHAHIPSLHTLYASIHHSASILSSLTLLHPHTLCSWSFISLAVLSLCDTSAIFPFSYLHHIVEREMFKTRSFLCWTKQLPKPSWRFISFISLSLSLSLSRCRCITLSLLHSCLSISNLSCWWWGDDHYMSSPHCWTHLTHPTFPSSSSS